MTSLTANIGALPCSLQKMIQNLAMEPVLESATKRRHAVKMATIFSDLRKIREEVGFYTQESPKSPHGWWMSGEDYGLHWETIEGEIIQTLGEFIDNLLKEELWTLV
jgi:hypothetical protein